LLSKNINIRIYKTIILPLVLYGCETWSLTLREEHKQKVFENRVLIIFSPKRDEMVRGWRKLHDDLYSVYSSPNVIRTIMPRGMGGARYVARMERKGMHVGYWWESQKERTSRKTKT
jgi:hypothetical protein